MVKFVDKTSSSHDVQKIKSAINYKNYTNHYLERLKNKTYAVNK